MADAQNPNAGLFTGPSGAGGAAKMQAAKDAANASVSPQQPVNDTPKDDTPKDTPKDTESQSDFSKLNRPKEASPQEVVANAKFSLTDFQNIYAAVRDQDYWSAFKQSISFLDGLVNPPAPTLRGTVSGGGIRPGAVAKATALTQADMKDIDRTISLFEQELNHTVNVKVKGMEDKTISRGMPKTGVKADAPNMSIDDVLSIISMVLAFVKQWRSSK